MAVAPVCGKGNPCSQVARHFVTCNVNLQCLHHRSVDSDLTLLWTVNFTAVHGKYTSETAVGAHLLGTEPPGMH